MESQKTYLLRLMFILLGIMFVSPTIFCQEFLLSNINSIEYSIDKIVQQVYFADYFSDTIREVDLRNLKVVKTNFRILPPFFSNKQHLMVYRDSLYDLDKQLVFKFDDSQADSFGYMPDPQFLGDFSPNDSNLIYGNIKYYVPINDSDLVPIETNLSVYEGISINDAWPEWSSDTSFVFLSGGNSDSVIVEYFLKSDKIDTLVTAHPYNTIRGFSYNRKYGILAYSVLGIPPTPKIYFHYVGQNIPDSLIFEPEDIHSLTDFGSLRWSPDNSKLTFVGTTIDIGSEIYVYDLDSNKTYIATGGDYIDHLKWANNDTLIFVDESQYLLYGVDVSSIYTSVKETKEETVPNKFTISNYPNPFNLSTRFDINIPMKQPFNIKIYDLLGRLIKAISVNPQSTKIENISWDGRNNSGLIVSSGVYFAVAETNNEIRSNTVKLIFLK